MKYLKRIITWAVVVLCLTGVLSVSAMAEEVEKYTYSYQNGEYVLQLERAPGEPGLTVKKLIHAIGYNSLQSMEIPASVEGIPVTAIGESAFQGMNRIHFQEIMLYYYIITVNIAIGSINRKEQ